VDAYLCGQVGNSTPGLSANSLGHIDLHNTLTTC
jgi:hypothetical protein